MIFLLHCLQAVSMSQLVISVVTVFFLSIYNYNYMQEAEDYSTAEEVLKEFKELPKSEQNKFISQIVSMQHGSMLQTYLENIRHTLKNANALLTQSLESVSQQVLDIVFSTLPEVLKKIMKSRISSAKNIERIFKIGEERMIEITGEEAIVQSLLESNDFTGQNLLALGEKNKRLLQENEQFLKQASQTNFKLILEQHTLRNEISSLLSKSIHVLNDQQHEEEKEASFDKNNNTLTGFSSCPYIINIRAHTDRVTKFDFVKQRLIEKSICVPGQEDSLYRCPSSSSIVCIQRKWLLCGGKYHPSQRINTVLLLDEELNIEEKASMSVARAGVSLANINNLEVLATGGCGNTNIPLTYSQIYHFEKDTWQKRNPMLEARSNHASIQVNEESVFIFCGYSTQMKVKTVERYSLQLNKWTMVDMDFKGYKDIWICRDFIRAFTNREGQLIIFGEYNGGDNTFILEQEKKEEDNNEELKVGRVLKNEEGYPPIGGYYSGTCFFGGNLFTWDDNNILWMFEEGQWISII